MRLGDALGLCAGFGADWVEGLVVVAAAEMHSETAETAVAGEVGMSSAGCRVLVAMSGGVDSSVSAALLLDAGYDVVGVTMKLWGGPSDTGCCSVSDVDDARWVADQLGIEHHVFNFGDDFERDVIAPYVADHANGRTPNPCIECNRHLKFRRLLHRAEALGFDMVATGHHARVVPTSDGPRVGRGLDAAKDQSYVLHMLDTAVLRRLLLPVGHLSKAEVRHQARQRQLLTAAKPDSQDVCFITASAGRRTFLGKRIPLTPAAVVDHAGRSVGAVDALELVTVGQRRGLGMAGGGPPRYVFDVDASSATVTVVPREALECMSTPLEDWRWAGDPVSGLLDVQTSAHGSTGLASVDVDCASIAWQSPRKPVAAGQSVVAYRDDIVVGGGTAARPVSGIG